MAPQARWIRGALPAAMALAFFACREDGDRAQGATSGEFSVSNSILELETAITPVDADGAGSVRLKVGETFEALLSSGQAHRYSLPEEGERYLKLVVDQRGIDVELILIDGEGETRAWMDSQNFTQGLEVLEAITPQRKAFVEVRPRAGQASGGAYLIALVSWEPADPALKERVEQVRELRGSLADCYPPFAVDAERALLNSGLTRCKALLQRELQADDPLGEAWTRYAIAQYQHHLGLSGEALESLQAALDLWRGSQYAAERTLVRAFQTKILAAAGSLDSAIEVQEEVAAFWEQRADDLLAGVAFNQLGLLKKRRADYAGSISHFATAQALLDRAGDSLEAAKATFNWGVAEFQLGNYEKALQLYEQAQGRLGESGTSATGTRIDLLNAQGTLYLRLGQSGRMTEAYEQAQRLIDQAGVPTDLATLLHNMGSAYLGQGFYDGALTAYQRALVIYEQERDLSGQANTLANLGTLYSEQGRSELALEQFERALEIARAIDEPQVVALALEGRGALDLPRPPQQALDDLQQALVIFRSIGATQRQVRTLAEMAEIEMSRGAPEEARRRWQEALELSAGRDLLYEAKACYGLTRLERDAGNLQQALTHIERAAEIFEILRHGARAGQIKDALLASRRSQFEVYIDVLMRLARTQPEGGYAATAFQISEQARARGLADLLAEAKVDVRLSLSPALRAEEIRLNRRIDLERDRSHALAARSPSKAGPGSQNTLESLREQQARLEARIRSESPRYAQISYPEPVSLRVAQKLIPPGSVLLEYVLGETGCFLFIVGNQQFEVLPLEVNLTTIRKSVQALRGGLEGLSRSKTRQYQEAAQQLYQALVAPAVELVGKHRRLIIVPDRELYYVPFEALLTHSELQQPDNPSTWPYLLRRYEVVYSPSASVLRELHTMPHRRNQEIVIFADPAYLQELPRLAFAGREAAQIAKLFPPSGARVYAQAAASKVNLLASEPLRRAQWLHFATHGTIDETDAANIRLELSRTKGQAASEGSLRLREIFDLDLQAELVVLSACSTALGQQVTGEGLVGLSRGFFYAGSRSVLVSQWQVEDENTAKLMVDFYRLLLKSRDSIAALRESKLLAVDAQGLAAHPHFWAPFVLIGHPDGLDG